MARRMVTYDIPIERETLQVYVAYLINALCVRFYGGCVETPPSHAPPPRPKGLVGRQPSRWNFSYLWFILFFTGRSFPNLVRKCRCTVTIDCVRAYSSTQHTFSARVAIFTQPAPLAATDVTKHPRHVQTWRVSVSIGISHVTILSWFSSPSPTPSNAL
jgi:hypothetical protein